MPQLDMTLTVSLFHIIKYQEKTQKLCCTLFLFINGDTEVQKDYNLCKAI